MTSTLKLNSLDQLKQINFALPPALSTKVEGKDKAPRKKREHQRAEPVYVRKLSEHLTQQEIGDLIGVTDATISCGLRDDDIAKPVEKAAEGIWRERYEPKTVERIPLSSTERLLVLRLSTNDLKAMEQWLTDNNVSYSVLS